jgi:mono/diheme cytochrome c family protein
MRVLHATDIRQIPLILRHGLFAGGRRSACVPDTPGGRAYVERIVGEQTRRGWPMAALAFEVAEDEVAPADDPYGIGLALARRARGLPPRLLARVQAIEPQGRRIASALQEWERGRELCWLEPDRLDREATLALNAALRDQGLLSPGNLEATRRALAKRSRLRAVPAAAFGLTAVAGVVAVLLLSQRGAVNGKGNPADATAASYRQHCAGCHGDTGRGDGLQARLTLLKVPDWGDAARLSALSDEYLYTVIAKGSAALGGTSAMPGWDHVLKPEEIRALAAYLRAFSKPSPRSR